VDLKKTLKISTFFATLFLLFFQVVQTLSCGLERLLDNQQPECAKGCEVNLLSGCQKKKKPRKLLDRHQSWLNLSNKHFFLSRVRGFLPHRFHFFACGGRSEILFSLAGKIKKCTEQPLSSDQQLRRTRNAILLMNQVT
jgi:hypothetical protein